MEAFIVSAGIVALAEMGDKTQLLALILAVRYRKPWPIALGIFVATLANHALAGAVGAWVITVMAPELLRWVLGASFFAMAVWMLIPDKRKDEANTGHAPRLGVFGTTVLAFFLAEMGARRKLHPSYWRPSTKPSSGWWQEPRWGSCWRMRRWFGLANE
jgi:Ca2+/H+ antiporter, TMEM165/GDT1 family